jgi:NAD(P)-dependent dehydrogenase (short-subunit alcohol dehydrogenase family)
MAGVAHSSSAKAGVLALTKTLAAEWARHRIRVNAIAPGPFESQGATSNLWPDEATREAIRATIPRRRFGRGAELAAHCLYLLSPACDWVTGECFVADGGMSLPTPMWAAGKRRRTDRR